MSYSFNNACWNCERASECKDAEKLQNAIFNIHQDVEHHKGSGKVVLHCNNLVPRSMDKEE